MIKAIIPAVRVENPLFDKRALPLADYILKTSLQGIDFLAGRPATSELHRLGRLISWQDTLYLSNLYSLSRLSDAALLRTITDFDHPHVLVWQGLHVLYDGNHRLNTLRRRGFNDFQLKTIILGDV